MDSLEGADPTHPLGRTIGEQPKPRVLFSWQGLARDRIAETLASHAPTMKVIDHLRGVRQDDYDVLVTDCMDDLIRQSPSAHPPLAPLVPSDRSLQGLSANEHLFVLTFAERTGAPNWGRADSCTNPRGIKIEWRSGFVSQAVVIPNDVLPAAMDLVADDLVPTVRSRESHVHFQASSTLDMAILSAGRTFGEDRPLPQLPDSQKVFTLHSFLNTQGKDPQVLAGWYFRSAQSEGWVLPADVRRPWDWAAAAIQHWSTAYGRFPWVGGWWNEPTWQTKAEADACQLRATLKAEHAAVTARLEADLAEVTAVVEAAQRDATASARRLLTEKGEPLKQAVADALRQFGYIVIDRDLEDPPDLGGKIEDLGARDPDSADFDPLIEVKGYDNGAKAGDIARIMRHHLRAKASGRSPSAIWWIVNHWRSRSPDARSEILAGEESMIAEEASADVPVVFIDSKDLFRAIRGIDEGTAAPAAIRNSLRAARGRWAGL